MDAQFYEQEHAVIYGHNVWHYLIDTPIGQYHVIQYEGRGSEIKETIIRGNNDKAQKMFQRFCKNLLAGKDL